MLTVTELLRKNKVVGQFVEYFGDGAASLTATDRAVVANMSPDYGATIGFFGVDEKTIDYLRISGRLATARRRTTSARCMPLQAAPRLAARHSRRS